jgi:hypothetical protein
VADRTDTHDQHSRDGDGAHYISNWYPPGQVLIDNYSATLNDIQQRVSTQALTNQGLIARGQLPSVEMALHQNTPPNAHAFDTNNPNIQFDWDGQGHLATAKYDYGNGTIETATFKDGKLSTDHLASKDQDLLFQYDANSHVQHVEIDHEERYDLSSNGTVTHAELLVGDKKEIFNEPDRHSFITRAQIGSTFNYNYSPNGTFLWGSVTQNNKHYSVGDVLSNIGVLHPAHDL